MRKWIGFIAFGVFISLAGEASETLPFSPLDVTVVVLSNFPPQYSLDPTGKPTGFAVDAIEQIATIANLRLHYIIKETWTDAFDAIETGKADLIPNQGITEERRQWFTFTAPIETFALSIFVRDTTNTIHSISDLKGRRVGAIKLNAAVKLLEPHKDISLIIFEHIHDGIFQLLAGQVDALVYPKPVLLKLAGEARVDNLINAVEPPIQEIKRAISVRKDRTELLERLNQAVQVFVHSKEYKRIYRKWYGEPQSFWTIRRMLVLMGSITFILAFGMILWHYHSTIQLNRALQHSESELHKHREQLESLVRERTDDLQTTLRKLERSNEELRQFAYVASHDLQEPLRAITGFSEFLREDYGGRLGADADEYIDFILDGARRMRALIQALLSYSRVNTHAKPFEWVKSQDVFHTVTLNLHTMIEEKQALIRSNGKLPVIFADETQFLQLLQNLIANGIKYCQDAQPQIHVTASEEPESWLFSVHDNGIGIKPEFHDTIFQMLQRLHTQDEYPGTGIGLAICKRIVERHGGRIWLDSEPEKGSTFYFTLSKHTTEALNRCEKSLEINIA